MIIMYRILLILLAFVGFMEHVDSLVLTSSPLTTTDGEVFTLICSSNTTGGQDRQWNRDGNLVFTTTQGFSSPIVSNPYDFNRYLSGRINVSCDASQHNVTLRINSTIDNGSRWQCVDVVISPRSNTLTIYSASTTTVSPTTTYSPPVSRVSTTTSTITTSPSASSIPPGDTSRSISTFPVTTPSQCPACVTSPGGVAAGTVGGAVLGSVFTVLIMALWMHKKNKYKDGQTPNEYASTSAYEDVDHQYAMAPRQYVNTVQDSETPDYENTKQG
ncbi:hepatitis A virus cellular receptor 1 homolog [Haliotis asinina]|uniref:hepatitis A virus cellular receptor 1 homolog n=1 Tax=Haliotis asinina TaxID=109174 RepID=UPI00353261C8